MFSRSLFLLLAVTAVTSAFRAPENPTSVNLSTIGTPRIQALTARSPPTVAAPKQNGVVAPAREISADALVQVGQTVAATRDSTFHAQVRKRWGIDNAEENEYWYDSRIHTLGNVGFWGAVHAAMAPISTKIIDVVAYDGIDIRSLVAQDLSQKVKSSKAKVLDLCCGVGISTRALRDAFPDSEMVVGLDTSTEMISMAKFLSTHLRFFKPISEGLSKSLAKTQTDCKSRKSSSLAATFARGNAEQTKFPSESFDLVTVMYAFHEAPKAGRDRILQEAYRVLQPGGTLAVIDICTDYKPSKTMLAGEPYVLEYQKNIHRQLRSMRGFSSVRYQTVVPEHVGMWTLRRGTIKA